MTHKKQSINMGEPPSALVTAIRKVLYPLVRLLLNFRIVFPQLAELLKSVYVEVAEKEFRLPNKPQTDTRLSLLTGIHRKDIKRLRAQAVTDRSTPAAINTGSRLVARWLSEARYLDEQQQPRCLPLNAKQGASFTSLVGDICKSDLRPRVILDEWLNLGIVTIDADKNVKLNTQAFIPSKGFDEKAFFLGHNISDHLSAATHNILEQEPAFFERCVYYDGLSQDSIQQLNTLVNKEGMKTLIVFNELAMRLKASDAGKTDNQHRIDIGLYVYHQADKKEAHNE
jgi:hypothetical protein